MDLKSRQLVAKLIQRIEIIEAKYLYLLNECPAPAVIIDKELETFTAVREAREYFNIPVPEITKFSSIPEE